MTTQLRQCDTSEVVIIDSKLCKGIFMVMVMKSLMPSMIPLKVFNDTDTVAYLKEDGRGERTLVLVKTPQIILTLLNNGVKLEYLSVGGMGMRAGGSEPYKDIAISGEERGVFRGLRKMEPMMKVQVVPTEKAKELGKYP